ncbi:hypothetical protein CLV85_2465 [Salinibacterium amurskyense]|uniref:Uncharacterized protein n=1 Tax=Salinibacterium amurskyense TaxID=205941 RepID=A0A2M9D1C6_9MICO|nr:hypothetical protein [Salinibacterium amurskyense]PJJ78011.1 hypothetical protein CLV85_2465 [Salinibacterium amurskyense]RLQ80169.1 hypothetical protein D9C83_12260 [Salinibacterium amurskyense]GHD82313.1 hypothetical protein GCM10007394_18230 [Salinibacterium amurskyense]
MTYAPPEENTLGVIVGEKGRHSKNATVRRLARDDSPRLTSLGTGFVGVGAAILVSLRAIYGLVWLVIQWDIYPNPIIAAVAWGLLVLLIAATITIVQLTSGQLPQWIFYLFVVGLAAVMALDIYAVWELHDIGGYATAAVAAGMALLLVLTVRPTTELIVAVSVVGVGLTAVILINVPLTTDNLAPQVTTVAFAVLPTVIGLSLITNFRQLVQVELDRVLVQSTLTAPRFAVGMMASEELARLDLAAEKLLDSVANGTTKLPLEPKIASTAASLATELRLHLIEGRRETWLYHAITESDLLGKSVTLTDKGSLAGLLDPVQRDGLLSTAWLFVTDTTKRGAKNSVHITIAPSTTVLAPGFEDKVAVGISITSSGVARNRVDASTWEAVAKVGTYTDSIENSSVRLDIECLVDNPADQ